MKALVKTYLNIRTDMPGVGVSNNPGYYRPGDEVEVMDTIVGQSYKGNCIWYRLTNNAYVWSGGIEGTEFVWKDHPFTTLDQHQQYEVLSMARDYYAKEMLSDEYGVTGIYIGKKITGNREAPVLTLGFQVRRKGNSVKWKTIPPILPYKGFAIPTDVVEDDLMEMQLKFPGDGHAGKPGGSLSRMNINNWGSCSFIAEKEEDGFTNFYLVTNYHIAAPDLLMQQQYSYDVSHHQDFLQMVMPSWQADANGGNAIGFLYKGVFDEWHDTALIRIPDDSRISNMLSTGSPITGVLDILDDPSFIGKTVTMYGGFTGTVSNKRIISVNSSQRARVGKQEFLKSELIQVERLSNGGDSGSPVLVGDQLIGIIIGADGNNTYILSAAKIINFFNLKLSAK